MGEHLPLSPRARLRVSRVWDQLIIDVGVLTHMWGLAASGEGKRQSVEFQAAVELWGETLRSDAWDNQLVGQFMALRVFTHELISEIAAINGADCPLSVGDSLGSATDPVLVPARLVLAIVDDRLAWVAEQRQAQAS